MPRFNVFQPFRASHRDHVERIPDGTRASRYDIYEQSSASIPTTGPGSRWRNVLTKHRRPRDRSYFHAPEYSVPSEPEVRRMVRPSRRTTVEDYDSQDSMTTESDGIQGRPPSEEPNMRFMDRMPSHESLSGGQLDHYSEGVPSREYLPMEQNIPQPSVVQVPSVVPSFVAPPEEIYTEEPVAPLGHDERSRRQAFEDEPPIVQAEPRRFRTRRGEPITVGNMRIEVEDDRPRIRGDRSQHSRSRSTSYSSRSSRSYSSSSVEEQPVIISADPRTRIEIGNERDGFVPYEQYLADREARRRRRRQRDRNTPEEEIYIIPAGANVIFVDEDGQELHRVGQFDERYSSRRRNTSARTSRQADGSYLIEL